MKQYRRLAALSIIILIALISVNTIYAQPPLGSTQQGYPFESSPTTHATDKTGTGAVTLPTAAYEGNLTQPPKCTIPLTGNWLSVGPPFPPPPPDLSVRYIEFKDFTIADPLEFYVPPEWVAIKIKYDCPATTDDKYRIVYRVDPDLTWYVLQDWVSGSAAAVTMPAHSIGRDWPDVAEPNNSTWEWSDVSNLVVRIETQMVSLNDAKSISLYEVWATVYPAPKPPTASTAISIQPSVVMDIKPGETLYVDVVAMGLTPPPGLQLYTINIDYDTSVLTCTALYTYNPFTTVIFSGFDDPTGKISVSYKVPVADTVGFLGGNTSLTRIYFVADAGGTSDLNITTGELKDVGAPLGYYPPTYDGFVSVDRVMSLVTDGTTVPPVPMWIDPITEPLTTYWHEIHPNYSPIWHLTSWEDGQPFGEPGYGELSKCDQIDMTDEAGHKYWFHVDEVTVTVHWEFKDGAIDGELLGEYGAGEPEPYEPWAMPAWDPALSPLWTGFHQIYPVFCRPFTISVHVDTDESGTLTVSDQIEIMYVDVYPYEYAWAHVTGISTDIYVSEKPPVPPWPEFPLGISLLMLLAPIIPLTYLWRLRRKVTKQ